MSALQFWVHEGAPPGPTMTWHWPLQTVAFAGRVEQGRVHGLPYDDAGLLSHPGTESWLQ